MIHQNSLRFYNDWAVDKDYNGLVLTESAGEAVFVSYLSCVLHAHSTLAAVAPPPAP